MFISILWCSSFSKANPFILQGVPETPDGFWNKITFQSRVEKFINTGRFISFSTKNLFLALLFEYDTF